MHLAFLDSCVCKFLNDYQLSNDKDKIKFWSGKLRIFSYPSVLTFVLGAEKNRLNSFEYPQQMFWLRDKKIIF